MNLQNTNNMNMNNNNNYLNMNLNNQNMGINNNNNNNNNKKNPFSVIKSDNPGPQMNQMNQMNNPQQGFNVKRSFDTMNQNYSVDIMQGNSHLHQFNPMANDSSQITLNPQRKTNKEFQGMGEDRGAEQEKKVQQLLKDYDGNNFKYTSDSFTYQANQFLKRIASENHAQKIASKIDDEKIKQVAPKVKDFMNQNELHDHNEYLQLLLYLILNAYAVKYYLNDMAEMEMYEAHIQTIVPEFSTLFSYWSKKFATTSLKINPKVLNKVFQSLSVKSTDNQKKVHEDYNQLVDNIIQISPPYNNSDKQGEQNVTKKDQANPASNGGSNINSSGGIGGLSGASNQANTQSMTFLNNLYFKKVQQQQQQQQQQNQPGSSSGNQLNNAGNSLGGNNNNASGNNQIGGNSNNTGLGNLGNMSGNNSGLNMNNNFQQPIIGQNNANNQGNQQNYSNVNNSYFGQSDYIGISTAPDSFKDLRFNQNQKNNGYDTFNSLAMDNNFDSQKSQMDQLPILKNQNSFTPIHTNLDKIIDSSGATNVQNQFNRFSAGSIFSSNNGPLLNNLGTSQFPPSSNSFNIGNSSNFQNQILQSQGFSSIGGGDFHMGKGNVIVPKPNKAGGIGDSFLPHGGHKLEDDGNLQHQLISQNFQNQDIVNHSKKIQSTASAFMHHDN